MHILGGGQRDESGWGKEKEAMMTAATMLSRQSRRWGYRNDDDGEEEEGEADGSVWTDGANDGKIDEAISKKVFVISRINLASAALVLIIHK
jgi:hypothetical protein